MIALSQAVSAAAEDTDKQRRALDLLGAWDSAILAAARMCGCDAVYSEDPSDEQDYDGLRVVNPFTHSPNRM